MSSRDADADDDDDDPRLKSMRAVWLALPDEDPPERGLDALMAAARARADELATQSVTGEAAGPGWWKRVLAVLARPPVLALATIMILIGGGVLISKRDSVKDAPPSDQTVPTQNQKAPEAPALGGATPGSSAPARLRATPDKQTEAAPNGESDLPTYRPPAATPPPPPPPAHVTAHRARPEPAPQQVDGVRPADPASTTGVSASDTESPTFETQDDRSAGKSAGTVTTRGPAPKPAPKPDPTQALADELFASCRAAAQRGDCEAARLIARRIAVQSTAYYREHVATDATIRKCIIVAD